MKSEYFVFRWTSVLLVNIFDSVTLKMKVTPRTVKIIAKFTYTKFTYTKSYTKFVYNVMKSQVTLPDYVLFIT